MADKAPSLCPRLEGFAPRFVQTAGYHIHMTSLENWLDISVAALDNMKKKSQREQNLRKIAWKRKGKTQ